MTLGIRRWRSRCPLVGVCRTIHLRDFFGLDSEADRAAPADDGVPLPITYAPHTESEAQFMRALAAEGLL
jgi:hypothetical protein